MTQSQKEWVINGALLFGIVLLVVLIALQRVSTSVADLDMPAASGDSKTTATKTVSGSGLSTATASLQSESVYNLTEIPKPKIAVSIPKEYANLDKANIFRPLVTPLPETPTPTPTAAPTPSLTKATEGWQIWYCRRRPKKPAICLFKNTKSENAKIEIEEGKPYIANDGQMDIEITVKAYQMRPLSVTLQGSGQEKVFTK